HPTPVPALRRPLRLLQDEGRGQGEPRARDPVAGLWPSEIPSPYLGMLACLAEGIEDAHDNSGTDPGTYPAVRGTRRRIQGVGYRDVGQDGTQRGYPSGFRLQGRCP